MSLVEWVKKNSKALAKITLYGTGGILLGWPLIRVGKDLYNGKSVDDALAMGCWDAAGYDPRNGNFSKPVLKINLIRDGIGVVAILAAKKI